MGAPSYTGPTPDTQPTFHQFRNTRSNWQPPEVIRTPTCSFKAPYLIKGQKCLCKPAKKLHQQRKLTAATSSTGATNSPHYTSSSIQIKEQNTQFPLFIQVRAKQSRAVLINALRTLRSKNKKFCCAIASFTPRPT